MSVLVFFFPHRTHALLQVKDLHFGERKKRNVDSKVLSQSRQCPVFKEFFLSFFVFSWLTRRHPPLPHRQTVKHRGGSDGICPTTSPPSGWPGGGCGGGSSSAWLPACLLLSRSSPAIPSAASPAAPRCPSEAQTQNVQSYLRCETAEDHNYVSQAHHPLYNCMLKAIWANLTPQAVHNAHLFCLFFPHSKSLIFLWKEQTGLKWFSSSFYTTKNVVASPAWRWWLLLFTANKLTCMCNLHSL